MKKYFHYAGTVGLSVCMLVVSLGFVPLAANAAVSNWQKGISIQSRYAEDFASDAFHTSVNDAQATGANYITLILPYYQSGTNATDIQAGGNTPSDATIISAINYIHSRGMKVMLKIHLESYDGTWRAYIDPVDRDTWFKNYSALLNRLGDIGKQTGVEEMCIGAELISMSTYTQHADNTQRWITMINSLRTHYSGLLTYSANWGGGDFPDEKDHIAFWGSLDFVGISAYFNLQTPSENTADIEAQWNTYLPEIQNLSTKYGKQVLFTEIGYRSVNWAHQWPWNATYQGSYDPTEQTNSYDALMSFWNNQSFMIGAHLWDWSSDPTAGGAGNMDYTPQHKPALATITQWFSQGGGTGTTTVPGGGNSGTVAGTFAASAVINPTAPTVNQSLTLTPTVTANSASSNVIVDVEIYNASNVQVLQKAFPGEAFTANQSKTYPVTWTPTQTGTYTVKIGTFNQDWTHNYYWSDNALSFSVTQLSSGGGNTTPPPSDGGSNTNFSMTASVSPAQPVVNQGANITASASSKGNLPDAIIDYEIYNSSNSRVFQQIFIGQDFSATQPKGYQFGWTPTTAGTYTIKGGIFNNNWSTNYYWNDSMATFTTTQSTGNTGGGTTTPPVNPPPQTNYTTNIWWPSNGANVNGVLPFKAMVEGFDISQYTMYWQVDGGTLVQMADSSTDYPHKESLVDVSGWNWKGNGPYVLNFVSKNSSGTIISQQSTSITISH